MLRLSDIPSGGRSGPFRFFPSSLSSLLHPHIYCASVPQATTSALKPKFISSISEPHIAKRRDLSDRRSSLSQPQHGRRSLSNNPHHPPSRNPRTNPHPPTLARPPTRPAHQQSLPTHHLRQPQATTRLVLLPRSRLPFLAHYLPQSRDRRDIRTSAPAEQSPTPPRIPRRVSHRLTSIGQPPTYSRRPRTRQTRQRSLELGRLHLLPSQSRQQVPFRFIRLLSTVHCRPSYRVPLCLLAQDVPLPATLYGAAPRSPLEAQSAAGY